MKRLLLTFILIFSAVNLPLNALTLVLKESVLVESGEVKLTDIFDVRGGSIGTDKTLFLLEEESSSYGLLSLIPMIEREYPSLSYSLVGEKVSVYRKPKRQDYSQKLKEKIAAAFRETQGEHKPGVEYDVSYLYRLPRLSLNSDDYTFTFDFENSEEGTQYVKVNIYNERGKRLTWFETVVNIKALRRVLTAKSYISAGEELNADDFSIKTMAASVCPEDALSDFDALKGKLSKRALKTGHILRAYHVEENVLFRRGMKVPVKFTKGSLRLEISAVLQEDACEGDTVRLKNGQSSKEIYARLENGEFVSVSQ